MLDVNRLGSPQRKCTSLHRSTKRVWRSKFVVWRTLFLLATRALFSPLQIRMLSPLLKTTYYLFVLNNIVYICFEVTPPKGEKQINFCPPPRGGPNENLVPPKGGRNFFFVQIISRPPQIFKRGLATAGGFYVCVALSGSCVLTYTDALSVKRTASVS